MMMTESFPGLEGRSDDVVSAANGFYPYTMNGGTLVAIAGEDFALVGSDTRLVDGFMIHSRECPRLYEMSEKTIFAAVGFHGDILTLRKLLEARMKSYLYEHNKPMATPAFANMLSTTLYTRRFFPYYVVGCFAVGLDEEGHGQVFDYDVIGSMKLSVCRAAGASEALLQPFLDNQVSRKNLCDDKPPALTKERAIQIAHDAFISAAEREINTGDSLQLKIITKKGIQVMNMPLRKD